MEHIAILKRVHCQARRKKRKSLIARFQGEPDSEDLCGEVAVLEGSSRPQQLGVEYARAAVREGHAWPLPAVRGQRALRFGVPYQSPSAP